METLWILADSTAKIRCCSYGSAVILAVSFAEVKANTTVPCMKTAAKLCVNNLSHGFLRADRTDVHLILFLIHADGKLSCNIILQH